MGCCVSSTKKKDKDSLNKHHRSGPEPPHSSEKPRPPSPKRTHVGSRAPPPPPPPPFEEETVKEVLSETPAAPRKSIAAVAEEREVGAVAVARKLREDEAGTKVLISKLEEVAEIVSEYSEMCSASASLSTATTATTATEKRDNEVTSRDNRDLVKRQRVAANRSPVKAPRKHPNAGDLSAVRERRGPKSLPHSPARAPVGGPRSSVRGGRELSGELKPPSGRTGLGEDSRRRQSRSPVTRRDNGPNRVGIGRRPVKESTETSSAAGRSLELGAAEDGRRKAESEETRGGGPGQGNESLDLDNPNVSLECFIFL